MSEKNSKDVVFVHGSYYNKNFGDYLLIKRVCDLVVSSGRVAKLPFASEAVISEFHGEVSHVTIKDFFNVKKCIFGGGGYLGEPPKGVSKWSINFIRRHFLPFFLMRIFGVKISIVGAGLGPISKNWLKPFVRYMLKNSEVIMLRDKESIAYAQELLPGIELTEVTDLAQDAYFLRENMSNEKQVYGEEIIAIHIGAEIPLDLEKKLFDVILKLSSEGYTFVFFSDSPGHNKSLANNQFCFYGLFLEKNIPFKKMEYINSANVISLINSSCAVITGKLHAGIVACTLNTPVLSIPLHTKTLRYYNQIGFPELCLNSYFNAEESIDKFLNLVLEGNFSLPDEILHKHSVAINEIKARLAL